MLKAVMEKVDNIQGQMDNFSRQIKAVIENQMKRLGMKTQ